MQKFFPYPKDENDEYYKKLQRQRTLERQIKASKRECMMFDAAGDKEELARSSLKLRNQQAQYANYCKSAGLSRNDERTQVLGYDKSESNKTSWTTQKALDKSSESGIMESDLGYLKRKLQSDERVSKKYYSEIKNKFSHGSDIGKKAFAKFVPLDSVENADYIDTPHYNTKTKKISMNFNADLTNARGAGATWFHEHGHMIDDLGGNISQDKEFERLLGNDMTKYIARIGKEQNLATLHEIYDYISKDLSDMRRHSAVSDMLHGLSDEQIIGCATHPHRADGSSYWNPQSIRSESFAHMLEAQFDEIRYKEMQNIFPDSLQYFEKKLKEALR